jgi:flavin-dependent dehydrogenase
MSDADLVAVKKILTIERWTGLLRETQIIRDRVLSRGYRLKETPRVVCANSSLLNTLTGESWLAAGDAAATFDPLSSQGIANALASGLHAARAILVSRRWAFEEYGFWMRENYANYLVYRASYYAMEDRWSHSAFWQRRHLVATSGTIG